MAELEKKDVQTDEEVAQDENPIASFIHTLQEDGTDIISAARQVGEGAKALLPGLSVLEEAQESTKDFAKSLTAEGLNKLFQGTEELTRTLGQLKKSMTEPRHNDVREIPFMPNASPPSGNDMPVMPRVEEEPAAMENPQDLRSLEAKGDVTYHPNGQKKSEVVRGLNGVVTTEFDEAGKPIKRTTQDSISDKKTIEQINPETGKPVSKIVYDRVGDKEVKRFESTMHANGEEKQTTMYDDNGKRIGEWKYRENGTKEEESHPFHENGKPMAKRFFDESGKTVVREQQLAEDGAVIKDSIPASSGAKGRESWPRAQKWNDEVGSKFFNGGPEKNQWNGDVEGLSKVIQSARKELSADELEQFVKKIEQGTNGTFKHTTKPDGSVDEIRIGDARFMGDGSYSSKDHASDSLPKELPFNPYPGLDARQPFLNDKAKELIKEATEDGKAKMTFAKLGDIANKLANRTDLSDKEKANIWTSILDSRAGCTGPLGVTYELDPVSGQMPDTVDSNNKFDVGHQLVAFSDNYHARMASNPGAAKDEILEHELSLTARVGEAVRFLPNGQVGNANFGDIRASAMQVRAMRAFLDEGFSGFAKAWNEGFVQGRRSPEAQKVIDEYQKAAEQRKAELDRKARYATSPAWGLIKDILD